MLIQTYLQSLAIQLQLGNTEHHSALQKLLTALLSNDCIISEPRYIARGSLNFEIIKDTVPIGHIEATAIGTPLEESLSSERLQYYLPALNNLILTNYLEFRWFIEKEEQSALTVILGTWDTQQKKLLIHPDQFARFELLIQTFVETRILTLRTPEALAAKMANIARLINNIILNAYRQENGEGKITEQLNYFRRVLTDRLQIKQFADVVAQTVCYGLLVAKCSTDRHLPFSRIHAGLYLSKVSPFLGNWFNQMMGIDLDERLVWIVEHLVATLNSIDINIILADFSKQTWQNDPVIHFYETFLTQYDPKLREICGVYYTPEPVVSYMVRSIDLILQEQFGLEQGLADNSKIDENTHQLQILDPATGTGTFLYAVFAKIFERVYKNREKWSDYVRNHLLPRVHGFELLIVAHAIAHLKLGLQLKKYGYDFKSDDYLRILLTNTLDKSPQNEETRLAKGLPNNVRAVNVIKPEPLIMVILGNPPYSGHSANTSNWINHLIHDYFIIDGKSLNERNPKWLNDNYVKFIRFAQWQICQAGYGILGFITNHSYLDNPTFRGMRQSLLNDFDKIYILDLHGNSKKKEHSPNGSVDQNVFDIQQGVAISFFIKSQEKKRGIAKIYHADLYGNRTTKYHWLSEKEIKTTRWVELKPQSPFYLFVPQNTNLLAEYGKYWKITEIMPVSSVGIVTGQDKEAIAIDYEHAKILAQRYDLPESVIKPILYRPFEKRYVIYDKRVVTRPRFEVMQSMLLGDNSGLAIGRAGQVVGNQEWNLLFCSKMVTDLNLYRRGGNQLFPLYLYPTRKNCLSISSRLNTLRKPNFSEDFIKHLETYFKLQWVSNGYGDFEKTISALDVFNYLYAIFHSPTYRQRYAEFLKIDFPRLPLTYDKLLFKQLAKLGKQLVKLHLMETAMEGDSRFPIAGNHVIEKIVYQDEKVYINKTQYFDAVRPEIWKFHVGGYQVCEKWLKTRKGRVLNSEECLHYLYILAAIAKTLELMIEIDTVIGKFPLD